MNNEKGDLRGFSGYRKDFEEQQGIEGMTLVFDLGPIWFQVRYTNMYCVIGIYAENTSKLDGRPKYFHLQIKDNEVDYFLHW